MKIKILDHGYVELIEAWGTGKAGVCSFDQHEAGLQWEKGDDYEVGIIEAARSSTQSSFRGWKPQECNCEAGLDDGPVFENGVKVDHLVYCAARKNPGDQRLLNYLYKNRHDTPFEFAGMIIEVQAPIFVVREWHRHRTQSYNEASARYAPLPAVDYIPTVERLLMHDETNKQAAALSGVEPLKNRDDAEILRSIIMTHSHDAEKRYQMLLNEGVSKELARLVLPVNRYTRMRASANLRNWLAFLTLRCTSRTQWEMQQYANAVSEIIKEKFPRTYEAWKESSI